MVRSGQEPHPVRQRSQSNECAQWPLNNHASWSVKTVGTRVRETREFTQIEIPPVEVVTMKDVDGVRRQVEQRPRGRK